jgi:hypothetical protein
VVELISEGFTFLDTVYFDSWRSPSHATRQVAGSRSYV